MNPQEIEQKLTEYIKQKGALAIVLHGSRANGMAKEHSDWDIAVFSDKKIDLNRDIIFGANVEYKQFTLPLTENQTLGFPIRSENTKILFDTDSIAKNLILENDEILKKGNNFNDIDRKSRYTFFRSALDGINDYRDNPLILFDKKIDFYTRIVMSWYYFLHKEFQPSGYIAFPRIEKEDPEFYKFQDFVKEESADGLIKIGKEIVKRLFPDLTKFS